MSGDVVHFSLNIEQQLLIVHEKHVDHIIASSKKVMIRTTSIKWKTSIEVIVLVAQCIVFLKMSYVDRIFFKKKPYIFD